MSYVAEKNYPLYISTLGRALRPITPAFRRRVRAIYFGERPIESAVLKRSSEPVRHPDGSLRRLGPALRCWLESCIFDVQNDLEHRSPKHPQVEAMNTLRCLLLDGVPASQGGNESHVSGMERPPLRWSKHEAFAARWFPDLVDAGKEIDAPDDEGGESDEDDCDSDADDGDLE